MTVLLWNKSYIHPRFEIIPSLTMVPVPFVGSYVT